MVVREKGGERDESREELKDEREGKIAVNERRSVRRRGRNVNQNVTRPPPPPPNFLYVLFYLISLFFKYEIPFHRK
jgi:hypothetical protein